MTTTNVNALTLVTTVDDANEIVLFINQSSEPVRMALQTLIESIEDEGVKFLGNADLSGSNDLTFHNTGLSAYVGGMSFKFFVQSANTGQMRARIQGLGYHPIFFRDGTTRLPSGAIEPGSLLTLTLTEGTNGWLADIVEPEVFSGVSPSELAAAIASHTAIQFAHRYPDLYFVPPGNVETSAGFIQLELPTGFPSPTGRPSFSSRRTQALPAGGRG